MRNPVTIIAAAREIPSPLLRTLVQHVIASAQENADDTVYAERQSDDWDSIFLGTCASRLCERGCGLDFVTLRTGPIDRPRRYEMTHELAHACREWFLGFGVPF